MRAPPVLLDDIDIEDSFEFDAPESARSRQLLQMVTDTKVARRRIDQRHELKYLPRSVVCHSVSDGCLPPVIVRPSMAPNVVMDPPLNVAGPHELDSDTDEESVDPKAALDKRRELNLLKKDVLAVVETRKKRKKIDNSDLGLDVERISQPKKPKKKAKHTEAARYQARLGGMMAPNNLAAIWHTVTTCKKKSCAVMASKEMILEHAMVTADLKDVAMKEQHLLDMYWNWPKEAKVMYLDGQQCCRSCFTSITQIKVSRMFN